MVDATGQARLLSRLWRLPTHRHPDMNNLAIYGYWQGAGHHTEDGTAEGQDERWALVVTTDLGWVWHIPLDAETTSVGLVTNHETVQRCGAASLRDLYIDAVRSTRGIDALLAPANFLGDRPDGGRGPTAVAVARDWSYRVETRCGPGWFLAGDAAAFVDPVLSSGLTLAANSASMVANAITTLWRRPETDRALLQQSVSEAGRDLSAAYHRMAQVWYARNLRADTWHWQARQELLRTSGGLRIVAINHLPMVSGSPPRVESGVAGRVLSLAAAPSPPEPA